jgi:hypothetical protein
MGIAKASPSWQTTKKRMENELYLGNKAKSVCDVGGELLHCTAKP